jgi:ankyrin repeat protein
LWQALRAAVYARDLREVRYFLSRAPELAIGRKDARPMLFEGAAVRGDIDMLQFLLSLGPCSLDTGDMTPLMSAVLGGHLAAVRVLVEAGADVHARTRTEFTPMMYACYLMRVDYPAIVEFLLDHGAEVDARTETGQTALMMAAHSGPYGVVQALLRRGADRSIRDREGRTALDLAMQRGDASVLDLIRQSTAMA